MIFVETVAIADEDVAGAVPAVLEHRAGLVVEVPIALRHRIHAHPKNAGRIILLDQLAPVIDQFHFGPGSGFAGPARLMALGRRGDEQEAGLGRANALQDGPARRRPPFLEQTRRQFLAGRDIVADVAECLAAGDVRPQKITKEGRHAQHDGRLELRDHTRNRLRVRPIGIEDRRRAEMQRSQQAVPQREGEKQLR